MTLSISNASSTATNGSGWPSSGPVIVEAYSVVLSVAALVLAAVLGGGGSLSVLLALFQSRRVRKYSYTLVLVFFFLCCGLDLLWAPMELAHLLTYHHTLRNPTTDFGVATFAIYLFLGAGLAILIIAFCLENVLRLGSCFSPGLRRAWPLVVCVVMFLISLLLALIFLSASLNGLQGDSYLILHSSSSTARLAILTLLLLTVVAAAVVVVVLGTVAVRKGAVKTSESFLSAHSNNESGQGVPHFLINQTKVDVSTEEVDKLSISGSSSKLPDIIGPDVTPATPTKGHNPTRLGELPTAGQRGPSMLGVNMSQVLGRRRHTICQIGDSSSPDPIAKAKQYNYVRKFSVDISALQAQLENPKLFKGAAPFQSDQDLRQRQQQQQQNKTKLPESRGPLLPLSNLGPRLDGGGEAGGLKLSLPARPPVITVSEDMKEDVEGEIKEEEEEEGETEGETTVKGVNSTTARTEYAPVVNKAELTDIPRLPISQPVDEEEEEEEKEEEGAESAREEENVSFKSVSNDNRLTDTDQDFIKMTLLLALTFFLCTFPLFLVEAMKAGVNVHTYVNISTCARALSIIQTIIYPHIVMCMDGVVHKAVSRLKGQVSRACALRDGDCLEIQPDQGSSSASQM